MVIGSTLDTNMRCMAFKSVGQCDYDWMRLQFQYLFLLHYILLMHIWCTIRAITDIASDVCIRHLLANFSSSWHPTAF